ncbi:gamma-glutamyl phosphate reductase [Legionella quinlivanii]|uniref:Gamma-glutamyl phosphate reductase n=1 Tax=Legionella quinlivanii TaxID=45073 RepID=A0A0W0Y799_9GAMM|nr:glutamate-5-semialdehyde dehydrogenase [Legionella quinlivanii]KTD52511.1 gamma-glutamyl phosphate reductase [Legionella quinlivanii]MCW8451893.1 glutamate-5-semialdehyde dehydrogenase [Legionella quinlivanii]SEG23851.1 glutamate-5-semialdehyde dehydrogenase [Legionella quinlivanii DSM 21216]STY09910.1 gamma-glutamyl phosphate reductase [Legionella quinlivanii]
MQQNIIAELKKLRQASRKLSALTETNVNAILHSLANTLRQLIPKVLSENQKDLLQMPSSDPRYDRLLLTEERLHSLADDVIAVADFPSPLHRILEEKQRPNGLKIQKVSVPLGVVAVIYEARPNVTIDVFGLCFKSGNACVLKGGKEAEHTNRMLVSIIKRVLRENEVSEDVVYLFPNEREVLPALLNANDYIDVCIPRGSQALIDFVREHARIPVIETGAGIVHTYFDKSGDLQKAVPVIYNAKTRRVSVCNALDTLIIHAERLAELPQIVAAMAKMNVEIFADAPSFESLKSCYPKRLLHMAQERDFGQEFLDYKLSIKTVDSLLMAIEHINRYSSGHSEAIIAEDADVIDQFLQAVDAAALYVNTSTAFTDGGQFGLGAEIGISTQKLHARGPMGLNALTSYKWLVWGNGQIRA